jgi:hypothetical protein
MAHFAGRPDHDIQPGPVERCQICGHQGLKSVLDLGHQPLCDSLPNDAQLKQAEARYPLHQLWCPNCTLSQLNYVVPGEVVYHQNYPYRSGITRELATYQDELAGEAIDQLGLKPGDLVADIGSNDGTLLSGFKRRNMRVVGVEPTNISEIARAAGIDTIHAPFGEDVVAQLRAEYGVPKLVTATNVFAHMAALGSFMRALELLLPNDGFFVFENHYLLDVMEKAQFDTIYHEHLRSYSLKSILALFDFYDFTVVDAHLVSRYGGNIRVYVAKGRDRPVKSSVKNLLEQERRFGLDRPERYTTFREQSERVKLDLLELAVQCKRKGISFVGNSCPGRCSTLLNYCGIDRTLMPYICEQPTSLKLGLYLPGQHIPIVDNQRLIDEQPDYVVLLAWHYGEPISQQLRARGLRSKLVVPLPELRIIQ